MSRPSHYVTFNDFTARASLLYTAAYQPLAEMSGGAETLARILLYDETCFSLQAVPAIFRVHRDIPANIEGRLGTVGLALFF